MLQGLSFFQLHQRVDLLARCIWFRLSVFWILEALGCPWVLMTASLWVFLISPTSLVKSLVLSKCDVHCHSVNFATCPICLAGRMKPISIWDREEIKIQLISNSAQSGLPLFSRSIKNPKLSIANASPCSLLFAKSRGTAELYTCLERLSIYNWDVWNAFSSSLWPTSVWSRHQIFQLFGQHTRAWDIVLGKIFFILFYFNTASGS